MTRRPPVSTRTDTLFPYTTLFRSGEALPQLAQRIGDLQSIKNGKGLTPQQASPLNGLITLRGQTQARLDAPGGALDQFEYATGKSPHPLDPGQPEPFPEPAQVSIDAARPFWSPTCAPQLRHTP